jgi:hypothetical protein
MRSKLLIALGICGLYLSGVTALAGARSTRHLEGSTSLAWGPPPTY